MKVLVLLTARTGLTEADLQPGQIPEQHAVWSLYTQGVLRSIDLRTDQPGAVLLLEVPSLQHARAALQTLPLVQDGRLVPTVIGLAPFTKLAQLWQPAAPPLTPPNAAASVRPR